MFWGGFYLQIKQISSFNIRVKISNIFAKMFPRKGDKFYLYFPQMFYSWYYLTRREVWGVRWDHFTKHQPYTLRQYKCLNQFFLLNQIQNKNTWMFDCSRTWRDGTPSPPRGRHLIFTPATRTSSINLHSPRNHVKWNTYVNSVFKHFLFLEIQLL